MQEKDAAVPKGWGKENFAYPKGQAFVECDEMKCVGCGICQMACSMKHFGVINKELARIQVRKYLVPLPKAVQVTCIQCREEERECQKTCPLDPPAIHFDVKTQHMVVAQDRCLGNDCLQCQSACTAKAIRSYPAVSPVPLVCDLCDTTNNGSRDPQCVRICPYGALTVSSTEDDRFAYTAHDISRKHADEKADLISKRLYPLTKTSLHRPAGRK